MGHQQAVKSEQAQAWPPSYLMGDHLRVYLLRPPHPGAMPEFVEIDAIYVAPLEGGRHCVFVDDEFGGIGHAISPAQIVRKDLE